MTTLIQKHPFVRRVVAVGLFISAIAFVVIITARDLLGSFFAILVALLLGYWLAAI